MSRRRAVEYYKAAALSSGHGLSPRLHRACQPSTAARPPSGTDWVHEIKHDGYRLMVRRDGGIVSLPLSKRRNTLKAQSFLIDGEAVIIGDDGTHDFRALRSRGRKAMLVAFNLLELDGDDLRSLPLIARKRRLARLIGRAKRPAIQYGEHLTGDRPDRVRPCLQARAGGLVSKRADAPYRSGPSRTWLKSKNPASEAVRREREEEWR